ncbi:MAG: SLC13 family permease [Rhodospirillaceae bacterium]|nr:SLC13 family permease [Rhodospirillaceae bacterium]
MTAPIKLDGEPSTVIARTSQSLRDLIKVASCIAVPLCVWLLPIAVQPNTKIAFVISSFMIVAWMTEIMDYSVTGLIGLMMFWVFGIATPEVIFSGFVNEASWFYLGAMLIGAMATKSGLPQRIGNFVVSRVGVDYPRLLLGLIIINFLLTFIVPSGAAVLVIMASIILGVMKILDVKKGSNIARGMFLVITYTTTIFNKMIISGTSTILARGIIESTGGVAVAWGVWFAAFFPCAVVTIFASWWFTLKLFPPEAESLAGRHEHIRAHFGVRVPWTLGAVKGTALCCLALGLWMTDWLHHISPAIIAFALGLAAFLPFINALEERDFRQINYMPFFFVAAALGMSEVMKSTGGLTILADTLMTQMAPLLADKLTAIVVLYWGGFFYHMAMASEISMLVTSLPLLMEFSKAQGLNPAWIGMIWSFSSGGKLFAYESAVLVLGYGYGYFGHTDLIKIGVLLTITEFVVMAASILLYWSFLGI